MKRTSLLFLCVTFSMITFGQLKINNLSNVGIGTTSPSAKLNLIENGKNATQTEFTTKISNAGVLITTQYLADTYTPGLFWNTSNNYSTKPKAGIYLKQTGTGYSMYLGTSNSLLTGITNNALIISHNGNVGIGDTPSEMFTVGSGSLFRIKSTGIVQSISGSATTPTYSFTGTTNTGMFSAGSGILNFSTSGVERMRIDAYGYAAIGMTNPQWGDKLTIDGGSERALYLKVNHSSGWGHALTTLVTHPYTVSYAIAYNNACRFYVQGDGLACAERGFYTFSDLAYKEDINTITNPLDKILNLNGVTYRLKQEPLSLNAEPGTFIDSAQKPLQMGLIAQDVEAVIPEVVIDMPNGRKAIAYQNLVGLLVEAIKEQQTEIENQSEKISKLETQIIDCCSIKPISNEKSLEMLHNPDNNSVQPQSSEAKPALFQNMPNPFKEKTVIKYFLPQTSNNASLIIFDMNGKLIKTYSITSNGEGSIQIFGGELQPGMYMYSLIANGSEIDTKRMILTE